MNQQISRASPSTLPLWRTLYDDALALIPPVDRPNLRGGKAQLVWRMLFRSAGLRCIFLHRLSHSARPHWGFAGRLASKFLFWLIRHWYGCAIAGTARIEGGLVMPHPQGIVIGADVGIGPRAWIFQNVTIGGAPGKYGMPKIGADVRIYAGAVLVGAVTIGDHVLIGANAVVTNDVPDHSAARAGATSILPSPQEP